MFYKWFWATFKQKLKFEHFCPGEVRVRQSEIEKIMAYQNFLLAHWFGNVLQMILSYFWAKTKIWTFFPGEVRVRQNDIEKIMAYQKILLAHRFGNVLQMILSYFWAKTKIWTFFIFSQVKSECAKMT